MPDKKEKEDINLWWVIAEISGSIAGVLFFIETLSDVFRVNNYGLGTAMTLLGFILVPAVFAIPIILKKHVLLYIPAIIISLIIAVFYLSNYSYMILYFYFILAFIGAFGAAGGFLIRLFRSGRNKAKIVMIGLRGNKKSPEDVF